MHLPAFGFAFILSSAPGDCGPDAGCVLQSMQRTPAGWLQWRVDVACYMQANSEALADVYQASEGADPETSDSSDEEEQDCAGDPPVEKPSTDPDSITPEDTAQALSGVFGPVSAKTAINLLSILDDSKVDDLRKDIMAAKKRARQADKETALKAVGGNKLRGGKTLSQVRTVLEVRLAWGAAFNAHKKEEQAAGRGAWVKSFAEKHLQTTWNASVRRRLKTAGRMAERVEESGGLVRQCGRSMHREVVSSRARKHLISTQGQPTKGVPLREALFQWFVDMRGDKNCLVKGRLPVKLVLCQAKLLCEQWVRWCIDNQAVPSIPRIDRAWICRWMKTNSLSFIKPNKRFTMSYGACKLRTNIVWLMVLSVLMLCSLFFQVDPGPEMIGIDEKGLYFCNQGAKGGKTIALRGETKVPVSETVAASRMRLTYMTMTTHSAELLEQGLPLECCFKLAGTDSYGLDQLELPPGPFSVRSTNSGSYREEHVFLYLQAHLPRPSAARRARNAWRIIRMDIYSGHRSQRIWDGFV